MKKSQLISMDFLLAFVIYAFALSVFFWSLQNHLKINMKNLDIPAELIYSRLDENANKSIDFLDGARIDTGKIDLFIQEYNYEKAYDLIFRDFEEPAFFRRIDYCIFIEENLEGERRILRNIAAGQFEGYNIIIGYSGNSPVKCGANPTLTYQNTAPECSYIRAESLVLSKPVLFQGRITHLKIMICGQKR